MMVGSASLFVIAVLAKDDPDTVDIADGDLADR
jgi:hypothetical protein